MLVKDAMSKKLILVRGAESIKKAVELMVKYNISGLIVSDDGKLSGIITMKDIFKKVIAKDKDVKEAVVGEIMSKPVIKVHSHDSIETAAKIMGENNIKRVVVVNPADKICGILTAMDIVEKTPKMLNVMFDTWVTPSWH